jgi:nicotinate (nicotinamide) nucleotide adenylyltransferase
MTCGFFGGTFDPVHKGHIALAKGFLAKVDHIIFCPAYISPFKMDAPPSASPLHRMNMLKLAIQGEFRFSVTDCELNRPPPSYTIDTIRFLTGERKEKFYLIISQDEACDLPKWKEAEALCQLAPPLIGPRTGLKSRDIREKLKNGVDCSAELDEKVLDYILEHQLYSVHYE